ncbi:hypothetical protein J4423_00940 [Candidatus Pacearchaeota archaeon]|nr:hypothetical protein [Candidatus Pacearchaeota archaeon]
MTALTAKFIIEILGRPAEHLKAALTELVDKLGSEKGVAVLNKEIHEPKKVEKTENLWTTFADVEMRFESLPLFFNAIMTYLPAHIEVYEPDSFKLNTFEVNEFANFIVNKLHNYDALAKRMMGERDILISKLEYLRNGGDMKKVFEVPEIKKETPKIESKIEKRKKSKKKK